MKALEVIQKLSATNSRIDKEQIIFDAFMNNCYEFFIGCKLCYDSLISFGVKKVAEIVEDDGSAGTFTFNDFLILANKLKNRELTGHAARDTIHAAANDCHVPTWNQWYRKILLKDLDIGVTDTIINKVLMKLMPTKPEANDYLIPVFKCMLAEDGEDVKHQKKIKGKRLLDCKLDGCRVLTLWDTHTVKCYTRNGFIIENFPELQEVLETLMSRMPKMSSGFVLDGEFMSPKGFQHLMTLFKRKDPHPDTDLIRYALFDILTLEDFLKGKSKNTQRERRHVLESLQTEGLLSDLNNKLYVVPQVEVDLDTEEGRIAFVEFNKSVLDQKTDEGKQKYEGIIIKDPEAFYEGKRSTSWLKKKPFIECTLEIIGFEKGNEGKWANGLGSLICKGFDHSVEIQTNLAGLTDELRIEIWNNQEKYLGMLIEVKADCLTLEAGETIYSLRFPEFKGFRGRVPGEKM